MKESDLFNPVRSFFEDGGYTVYSEVQPGQGGKRADVVALNGNVIAVCELKTSLSLDLIEQAVHWKMFANAVYIGIPKRKYGLYGYVHTLLHREGIGVLEVSSTELMGKTYWHAACTLRPHLNRHVQRYLIDSLTDHHLADNHIKGGSSGGGFTTPYKRTMEKLKMVINNDWRTVSEILKLLDYDVHWSSPRSSMAKALQDFEADWCECKKENGKLMFRRKQTVTMKL